VQVPGMCQYTDAPLFRGREPLLKALIFCAASRNGAPEPRKSVERRQARWMIPIMCLVVRALSTTG
jgi:hypothetical protein